MQTLIHIIALGRDIGSIVLLIILGMYVIILRRDARRHKPMAPTLLKDAHQSLSFRNATLPKPTKEDHI